MYKFLPNDGGGSFGRALAMSGVRAVVGCTAGAYVFDVTTGMQSLFIPPPGGDTALGVGESVAISGITIILGAPGQDFDEGAAYLFDAATGMQGFELLASDGEFSDRFGSAVGISGTTVIVGAPGEDETAPQAGAAYLFDTTTGLQTFKLLPSDGAHSDAFGNSVAISGTTVIVGAWHADNPGADTGAAYLFDTTTGLQTFKLLPADVTTDDDFGMSVAISGTTAIVGSPKHAIGDFGAAYLFDTTTGLQIAKLTAGDPASGDQLGSAVALSGNTAMAGSRFNDDFGINSGSAYVYDVTTGLQIAKLLPSDGISGDNFGNAVALGVENNGIVGSIMDDDLGFSSGSGYVFGVSNKFCFGISCPCGNEEPLSGCRNSTGKGGRLVAPLQTSLAAGTLELSAVDLPSFNLGLFVATDAVLGTPLQIGDGSMCIGGGNVYRFAPSVIAGDGTLTLSSVAASAPRGFLVAGELRYFQVWTRDVFCTPLPVPCPSPCGGGSNITNAVEVCFVP